MKFYRHIHSKSDTDFNNDKLHLDNTHFALKVMINSKPPPSTTTFTRKKTFSSSKQPTRKTSTHFTIIQKRILTNQLNDKYYAPLALVKKAELLSDKGNKEEALKCYQKIIDEYSLSPQKEIAQLKKVMLENEVSF
jgi:tetratricopeptide (TPR) repeat protein